MQLGLLKPTEFVSRPFRKPLEVMRCDSDGGLVTLSQGSLQAHGGHRLNQPVLVKPHELFLIWIGVIR